MTADRRLALCALAVAALSLPSFVRIVRTVPSHAVLDRNEGWNAYLADRAASSAALYPNPPRFFANNYPPLSFYLAGRLGPTDRIAGGRAISIVAFLVWAAALGATARRFGASAAEAAFGVALFTALMLTTTSYVGMNDPQLLGHSVQAIALSLLAGRRSPWPIAAAAVLLSAGVFIKQNLIALPLALTVWLFVLRRRDGWRLAIGGLICATVGVGLSLRAYGPSFLPQVLMPRDYAVADTVRGTAIWLVRMPVFLALTAMLYRRRSVDAPAAFIAIYVTVSAVIGLALFGGAGVDWNVLFDANAGCCLAAAVALGRLRDGRRPLVAAACLLLPAGAALAAARAEWLSREYWLAPRAVESTVASEDEAFIRAHPGPAFCAELAFCWRAGKEAEVDAWGLEQRGARDPGLLDDFVRLVDRRYFAVIQIDPRRPRFGGRFEAVLRDRYAIDHADRYGTFFVLRPQQR